MGVMSITYGYMQPRYASWLKAMKVRPAWQGAIDRAANKCIASKDRYKAIEARTGIPWAWIAAVHMRESSNDFRGVLHNGEHIIGTGARTHLVPAGRGPFNTWEDAAMDALAMRGLVGKPAGYWDSPEVRCWEWEAFNGFGYAFRGAPSPYIFSGTTIYDSGKYVADGVYDGGAVDQQLGTLPLYNRIMELTGEATLRDQSKKLVLLEWVRKGAKGVVGAVATWFAAAQAGDVQSIANLAICASLLLGAGVLWYLANKIDKMIVKDYTDGRYVPSGAPPPPPAPQAKEQPMNPVLLALLPVIQQLVTGFIANVGQPGQPAPTPGPVALPIPLPPVPPPTTVTAPSDGSLDTFFQNLLKAVMMAALAEIMKELPGLLAKYGQVK